MAARDSTPGCALASRIAPQRTKLNYASRIPETRLRPLLPFEKWSDGPLGPGFSYEDFLEQQYFWAGQTSEGKAKFGARDCVVLKSTPGPSDRTHYAQVKTWLDPSYWIPCLP